MSRGGRVIVIGNGTGPQFRALGKAGGGQEARGLSWRLVPEASDHPLQS